MARSTSSRRGGIGTGRGESKAKENVAASSSAASSSSSSFAAAAAAISASLEDDFNPPQPQQVRQQPRRRAGSGGGEGTSSRATSASTLAEKGGVKGALADINQGPRNRPDEFSPPKSAARTSASASSSGRQQQQRQRQPIQQMQGSRSSSRSSSGSSAGQLASDQQQQGGQGAETPSKVPPSQRSGRSDPRGQGRGGPQPPPQSFRRGQQHTRHNPPPHPSPPPHIFEPTPLGSIKAEIESEAPASAMRDLLKFAPSFGDSPLRPPPPAGSHQQQQLQYPSSASSGTSTSRSPHPSRPPQGSPPSAHPGAYPPFYPAVMYPGMPQPPQHSHPRGSSSQGAHRGAMPGMMSPRPFYHGYPQGGRMGQQQPSSAAPHPYGFPPGFSTPPFPHQYHLQHQGMPIEKFPGQFQKQHGQFKLGGSEGPSKGTPPKSSPSATKKRQDASVAFEDTDADASTPPDKKQRMKPGDGRYPSSSFLAVMGSPYHSPGKRSGMRNTHQSPHSSLPQTPSGPAYFHVFGTPSGDPQNVDFSDMMFNLNTANSFGFDHHEGAIQGDGGSLWAADFGSEDVRGSSGYPPQRSPQRSPRPDVSPFSKVLSGLSPMPGVAPMGGSPLPFRSPDRGTGSSDRRGRYPPTSSPHRPTLEPVPTLSSKRSPKTKAKGKAKASPRAAAQPRPGLPQSSSASPSTYRLQLGVVGPTQMEVRRGMEGINSALKGQRPSPSPFFTPSSRHPFDFVGGMPPGMPPSSYYRTPDKHGSRSRPRIVTGMAQGSSADATPSHSVSSSAGKKRSLSSKKKAGATAGQTPRQTPPSSSRRIMMDTPSTVDSKDEFISKCNCKKSKCLKLYCECFAHQRYCDGCNCGGCQNLKVYEDVRSKAIRDTKNKNPAAFKPKITDSTTAVKHNMGCRCKKSRCLKKYCECFQAGATCGNKCKCVECENFQGSQALIDRRNKIKDHRGAEAAMTASDELWRGKHPAEATPAPAAASASSSQGRPSPADSYASTPSSMQGSMMHPRHSLHHPSPPYMTQPMMLGPGPRPPHHVGQMGFPPMSVQTPTPRGPHVEAAKRAAASAVRSSSHKKSRKRTSAASAGASSSKKVAKSQSKSGSSKKSEKSEAPLKKQPQAPKTPRTAKTRLAFDPLSSKKKRKMTTGEEEPTAAYFGKYPAVPKTAALATFSFLSNEDLFLSSLVSKQWNELVLDDEMWQLEE